ncbi:MAG TPA: PRC-barrel domain-containing protein [Chloroflexota bacterium]|nr:PRC-barrel domain-containing protein [Chloroflexota bacterium]HUM71364.1 PRC-barrel domain-containing protein [Chloroflexota bacterium]
MRLAKDLLNKPIYSILDGRNLGVVKDIYLNNDLTQITGIFTGQEGMIRRKTYLIPRAAVVVFGIDAILVRNPDVIIEEAETEDAATWVRLSKLRGREVDTPNGTKVATIGDIVIGEDGDIAGFTLAKVHVDGPIANKGAIARSTLIDTGHTDGVMTIDLTLAETTDLAAPAPPPEPPPAKEEETPEEPT